MDLYFPTLPRGSLLVFPGTLLLHRSPLRTQHSLPSTIAPSVIVLLPFFILYYSPSSSFFVFAELEEIHEVSLLPLVRDVGFLLLLLFCASIVLVFLQFCSPSLGQTFVCEDPLSLLGTSA